MKGKAFIPLVLGLVVGLFAVKLVIDTVRKSQAQQPTPKMTVVRTTADIRAFTRVSAEDIEEVEVADSKLVPADQRVDKKDDVVGRVVAKAIPMGVPVLQSMLSPKGTHPGIIARIPPGYRAVAVKIDEASTAGFQIQPGDYVDVIVVMDIRNGRKKETIAEVLLQRVQVGAIGRGVTGQADGKSGGKIKPAKTATLLVREEDSPKLHLAATRGKITLSLRGADETELGNLASASTSSLLRSLMGFDENAGPTDQQPQAMLATARPTRPRGQPFQVVIRRGSRTGDMMETITFENKDSSNIIGVTRGPSTPRASLTGPASMFRPNRQRPVPPGQFPLNPNVDPEEDQDFVDPGE